MSIYNIAKPSKFSCLPIEDDEPPQNREKTAKKKPDTSEIKAVKNKKPQSCAKKSLPPKKEEGAPKKNKKKPATTKQWEEWKKKDEENNEKSYESDLIHAMYLSQLSYEADKATGVISTEIKNKGIEPQSGKKKKNKNIPLSEFLNGSGEPHQKTAVEESPTGLSANDDGVDFFEELNSKISQQISKAHDLEERKKRNESINETILLARCQEKMMEAKKVILQLTGHRSELQSVKQQNDALIEENRLLREKLSKGELKERSELLDEIDRLNSVKDELSAELTKVTELLEKERSKTQSGDKHKPDKKHKR